MTDGWRRKGRGGRVLGWTTIAKVLCEGHAVLPLAHVNAGAGEAAPEKNRININSPYWTGTRY